MDKCIKCNLCTIHCQTQATPYPNDEWRSSECVYCYTCASICPTNALQPALDEAGPEGIWTPVLKPRIGYCEYYCSLCTQVCPTGLCFWRSKTDRLPGVWH